MRYRVSSIRLMVTLLLVCALAPRLSAAEELAYTHQQSFDLKKIVTKFLADRGERNAENIELLQGMSFDGSAGLALRFRCDGMPPRVLVLDGKFNPRAIANVADDHTVLNMNLLVFPEFGDDKCELSCISPGDGGASELYLDLGSITRDLNGAYVRGLAMGKGTVALVCGTADAGGCLIAWNREGGSYFREIGGSLPGDGARSVAVTGIRAWTLDSEGLVKEHLSGKSRIDLVTLIDDAVIAQDLAFPEISEFRGMIACGDDSLLALFALKGNDATGRPRLGAARFDTEGRLMQLGEVEPGAEWERGDTIRDWTADDVGRLYLLFGDSGVLRVYEPPKAFRKR